MQEGATTWPKPTHPVHYEVNVRGGGFDTARDRFQVWKHEPPVSRPDRLMFEGKREVRWLGNAGFDDTEAVRRALQSASHPQDDFALAAREKQLDNRGFSTGTIDKSNRHARSNPTPTSAREAPQMPANAQSIRAWSAMENVRLVE